MTSQEFIIWLKGFTEGVHDFNITPKQWDLLKERLAEVEDKTLVLEAPKFPFGTPNTTPYTPDPFPKWQYPHYPNPLDNPYKVTCAGTSGSIDTRSIPSIWTSTSGSGVLYTVTSGSSYSGATTYLYPNGTSVTYTTNAPNGNLTTVNKTLLND